MALTDQLAWGYEMNEASGNAVDVLAANDLTDTNTVASTTGKVGGGRLFVAPNDEYFIKADNSVFSVGDADFTILALVNITNKTDPGSGLQSIITKDDPTDREFHLIYLFPTSGDLFRFTVFGGASGASRTDRTAVTFGSPSISTWYGIFAWHDSVANTINISVNNGATDSAAHTAGIYNGTADFRIGDIGQSDGLIRNWGGALDQCFGWKRVLSAAERTQIWNSGNWMSYAAMVAASGGAAFKSAWARNANQVIQAA